MLTCVLQDKWDTAELPIDNQRMWSYCWSHWERSRPQSLSKLDAPLSTNAQWPLSMGSMSQSRHCTQVGALEGIRWWGRYRDGGWCNNLVGLLPWIGSPPQNQISWFNGLRVTAFVLKLGGENEIWCGGLSNHLYVMNSERQRTRTIRTGTIRITRTIRTIRILQGEVLSHVYPNLIFPQHCLTTCREKRPGREGKIGEGFVTKLKTRKCEVCSIIAFD